MLTAKKKTIRKLSSQITKAATYSRSYSQNGPKLKYLYHLAKTNAAEFDWLILAKPVQATWSRMSINRSSRKRISRT